MEKTVKLYAFRYNHIRTYLFAALFIVGNVVLPQICHLIPNGGLIFLPIYFFTLISAYKYGLTVGIVTALCSPLVNNLLFGMPSTPVLPALLIKSVFLAIAGAYAAKYTGKVSIIALVLAVLSYQVVGTAFEWILKADFLMAIQDFRLGVPGMLIQIFGGYAVLKAISRI